MSETLKEVEGDEEEGYQLRPFGLFFLHLENEALARKVNDALELYLRGPQADRIR